jgi:type II secretion system protein J
MNAKRHNPNGFTLIEVLLALAIFTIIGLATVRQIQSIMLTKNTAFQEIDMYNGVRTAISIMGSDLSQAFHVLYDDLGADAKQAVMESTPSPHSIFDGRKNEMVFTSLSHRVYYAERKETQQTEISYFLQQRQGEALPSLMKRDSGFIDADLYKGGPIYAILDNVTQLEFQYWDEKTQKWVDDWNSDGQALRDRFPYAVKMKLAVGGAKNQKLQIETQFKLGDPNNTPQVVQF